MNIDNDTGRYGSKLYFTDLACDLDKEVKEIIGSVEVSFEGHLEFFLTTDDVETIDDFDLDIDLSYEINLKGVKDPDKIINSLSNYYIGSIVKSFTPIGEQDEHKFLAEAYLVLEGVYEEESDDDELDDADESDNSERPTHKVAEFRLNVSFSEIK